MKIKIFTTGGTIDKVYFDDMSNYEVGEPQVGEVLREAGVNFEYEVEEIARKDSLYVTDEDRASLGKILTLAGRLAREAGASDGFRTIINTGRVGRQDVKHVHVHVLGGPEPLGPMLGR